MMARIKLYLNSLFTAGVTPRDITAELREIRESLARTNASLAQTHAEMSAAIERAKASTKGLSTVIERAKAVSK